MTPTKTTEAFDPEDIRISIPRQTCSDYYYATQKEWIETNGLGGFASSSIIGANVRRYHGLLVASLKPPTHRYVLVSKLEDSVMVGGQTYEMGTNQYPMIVHPEGHKHIERFEHDLYPRQYYDVAGCKIEKSVIMLHEENTTVVRYHLTESAERVVLYVRPLCAFRDYHSLSRENPMVDKSINHFQNGFSVKPYAKLPDLTFRFNRGQVESKFFWYKNGEYRKEQERGLEFVEDLFSHAFILVPLAPGETFDLLMTVDPKSSDPTRSVSIDDLFTEEIKRRERLITSCKVGGPFAMRLALSADSFIVRRAEDQHTIIAGYHWFSDWGRDTMIAMRGLTLSCKKFEVAKDILRSFSRYISKGMIPNRFPDLDESPEYNNVDGTLWYFIAVHDYLERTGDLDFVRDELYSNLHQIIEWHLKGTRFNIHMDADGLLHAGEEGVQLTWMDAKVDDWVVTPRIGKPVEINALWFNALCIMKEIATKLGESSRADSYGALAERAKRSFNEKFWNPETNSLYDVVTETGADASIRPNQIFAVSLPFTLLPRTKQQAVVDIVERELLTPYGLRSLSPSSPEYKGRYGGDPRRRDAAYHQGTVWTWLLGPFIEARFKTDGHSTEALESCRKLLLPIEKMFNDAGIGTVSEIYDGDPPQYPQGCISQAWSVGELLRIIELMNHREG